MSFVTPAVKVKYLTNKDLLDGIHNSKKTYSSYADKKYSDYDIIVTDLEIVTDEVLEATRLKKINAIISTMKKELIQQGQKNPTVELDVNTIPLDTIVVRVMTWSHIPPDLIKNVSGKTENEKHSKVNFPPFQHWIKTNGIWICVGKSHWKGELDTGHFSIDHGKMTNLLAIMLMKLVDRYSRRGNWRSYTYLDEMKGQALMHLSQVGLKFDESRSSVPNPFAYYSTLLENSFRRIVNLEKRNQNMRDDLLTMAGMTPSYNRQIDSEIAQKIENLTDKTP